MRKGTGFQSLLFSALYLSLSFGLGVPTSRSYLVQFLCGISVLLSVGAGLGCGLLSRMGGGPGCGRLAAPHRSCMLLLARSLVSRRIWAAEEGRALCTPVLCGAGSTHPVQWSCVLGVSLGVWSGKNMAFGVMKTALHLLSPSWLLVLGGVTLTLSLDLLLYEIRVVAPTPQACCKVCL